MPQFLFVTTKFHKKIYINVYPKIFILRLNVIWKYHLRRSYLLLTKNYTILFSLNLPEKLIWNAFSFFFFSLPLANWRPFLIKSFFSTVYSAYPSFGYSFNPSFKRSYFNFCLRSSTKIAFKAGTSKCSALAITAKKIVSFTKTTDLSFS